MSLVTTIFFYYLPLQGIEQNSWSSQWENSSPCFVYVLSAGMFQKIGYIYAEPRKGLSCLWVNTCITETICLNFHDHKHNLVYETFTADNDAHITRISAQGLYIEHCSQAWPVCYVNLLEIMKGSKSMNPITFLQWHKDHKDFLVGNLYPVQETQESNLIDILWIFLMVFCIC